MFSALSFKRSLLKRYLKKYTVLILLISTLVGILGAFTFFKLRGVNYVSEETLVQNDNNYSLIVPYQQFVKEQSFRNEINSQINKSSWRNQENKYDYSVVLTSNSSTTPFFKISVTSEDSAYAKFLTRITVKVFMSEIGNYISNSNISLVSSKPNMKLVTPKSKLLKVGALSFLLSVMFFGIVFFIDLIWIGKVKYAWYVSDVYNLKLLATVESNITSEK